MTKRKALEDEYMLEDDEHMLEDDEDMLNVGIHKICNYSPFIEEKKIVKEFIESLKNTTYKQEEYYDKKLYILNIYNIDMNIINIIDLNYVYIEDIYNNIENIRTKGMDCII